jgi:hypothetical protein
LGGFPSCDVWAYTGDSSNTIEISVLLFIAAYFFSVGKRVSIGL